MYTDLNTITIKKTIFLLFSTASLFVYFNNLINVSRRPYHGTRISPKREKIVISNRYSRSLFRLIHSSLPSFTNLQHLPWSTFRRNITTLIFIFLLYRRNSLLRSLSFVIQKWVLIVSHLPDLLYITHYNLGKLS